MDIKEKLIEILKTKYDHFCDQCSINKDSKYIENLASHLIAHGVTVQEWISVSSPPKKPGEYLCYFKYEPESPNVICQNTYYGSGRWMSESDKVTHWAYLPRPPKGE